MVTKNDKKNLCVNLFAYNFWFWLPVRIGTLYRYEDSELVLLIRIRISNTEAHNLKRRKETRICRPGSKHNLPIFRSTNAVQNWWCPLYQIVSLQPVGKWTYLAASWMSWPLRPPASAFSSAGCCAPPGWQHKSTMSLWRISLTNPVLWIRIRNYLFLIRQEWKQIKKLEVDFT